MSQSGDGDLRFVASESPTIKADRVYVFGTIYQFTMALFESRVIWDNDAPKTAMFEVGRFAISPAAAMSLMSILHARLSDYIAAGGFLEKQQGRTAFDPSKIIDEVEQFLRNLSSSSDDSVKD